MDANACVAVDAFDDTKGPNKELGLEAALELLEKEKDEAAGTAGVIFGALGG